MLGVWKPLEALVVNENKQIVSKASVHQDEGPSVLVTPADLGLGQGDRCTILRNIFFVDFQTRPEAKSCIRENT